MIRFIQKMTAMLVTLFAGVAAFAQVTTSSLGGRVADEAGEPLAGAAIVAVHTPTGTQYATIANSEGRYTIGGMRTGGPYTVEISFVGMTTIQVKDVVLKLGEPYELNVKLKSSSELNAVVVVSESSFNASITGAGQSFSRRAVETMPSIDRSIYDVVKFTPQASINKGGGISFAGSNNRYNSFQVDGAVANDTFGLASSGTNGGQTGANPISMDAIEEVQVVVAPFDVRQSGFTGGAINAVTKSGTNRVKGTFYTYLLNQDMIGTTPGKMDWGQERQKYDTQLNQTYGFTVGGPIIKNKMFLFLSAEYVKKEHPNVFTPANGTYENREDVKLGTPIVIGEKVYEYFNADLAQRVIDHYEATYGVGNTGESFTQHMDTDRAFNILGRLDWNVNSTNKLMIRYQYMDAYADKYGSGRYTYYFNNSSYKMADKTNTIVAELNSKCFPDMQNMFRVTGVFVRDHREVPYHGANMYIKDNMTIDLGTEYSSGANSMNSNTVTLTDNMTWTLGTHELTVGTHNEFYKFDNLFLQYAYGGYTYNSLADFFAGRLYEFNYRYSDPAVTGSDDPTNWRAVTYAAQLGAYVQDEWRPNTNLTLTYGLRVDVPMLTNSPTENPGFNNSYFTDGTIDPATGKFVPYKGVETPSISYETGERVGEVPKTQFLFSPRIGFRWFLNDSHATLLRGGAGLFTGRVPFVWLSNAYNNTGMEAKSVKISQANLDASFPKTSNPYNDIVKTGIAAAGGKSTINTLNRDFKYPQVFRVNLGFEQVFAGGWKFTFDGLFSKTLNNVFFNNLAIKPVAKLYAVHSGVANENNTAPYYNATEVNNPYSAVVALQNTNKGYTYSLSGRLEKHFHFGLDFMAAYTFGHAFSVNDGTSSVALSNWQYNSSVDTNQPELSWSLFDKPHRIMAVVSYKTPKYLSGLQSTFTVSYEAGSGQRYSFTMNESADFNNDGRTGNSLMYVPTQEEIGMMNWSKPGDAAGFERFIRDDSYLSSHRGQWSERNAGIAPFEHHFDLQFAQDFFYDKEHGRKLQFTVDMLNFTNLLNREWGLNYNATSSLKVLDVKSINTDAQGNATPVYHFNPQSINYSDFYSRWRLQIGFRLTF